MRLSEGNVTRAAEYLGITRFALYRNLKTGLMKRYSLIVALHIIGIAFLSVGVYLLVDAGLWFSALMAF